MKLVNLMPDILDLIPYDYDAIKCPLYDEIIGRCLQKAVPSGHPKFVQVGGIPGAGKTTFCKNHHWNRQLFISFDAIMESLPGYQQDLDLLGYAESFRKWEMPARIIGYEVLRRAIIKRTDIFLEHSGVNHAHVQLVNSLKKLGYDTEMYFIVCDLETACRRAVRREKNTKRHTPPQMIAERASLVGKYLRTYTEIVDNLYVYDTSDNKFLLQQNYQKGCLVG